MEFAENPNTPIGQSVTVVDYDNDTVTVYVVTSDRDLVQIGSSSSVQDYNNLVNKPKINEVTLVGNKSIEELGIDRLLNQDIEHIFDND